MTDYKQLCAELHAAFNTYAVDEHHHKLLEHARVVLAQPESDLSRKGLMTNQQHPITPPPELFKQWEDDILNERDNVDHVLDCAWRNGFQAGADQELEACCEWLKAKEWIHPEFNDELRAARRPKPPSLKEQALEAMGRCDSEMWCEEMEYDLGIIRTALESLPS